MERTGGTKDGIRGSLERPITTDERVWFFDFGGKEDCEILGFSCRDEGKGDGVVEALHLKVWGGGG